MKGAAALDEGGRSKDRRSRELRSLVITKDAFGVFRTTTSVASEDRSKPPESSTAGAFR